MNTIDLPGRESCQRCRHPYPLHKEDGCKAKGCRGGEDGGPCPAFVQAVQAEPEPARQFWLTEDMVKHGKDGEPKPWYSTNTVATVFIGRSAAWLRLRMKLGELVLDGKPLDIHRSPTGDRQFSLRDIELAAHALREQDLIDDNRFEGMLVMAVWCARQNGLLPFDEPADASEPAA